MKIHKMMLRSVLVVSVGCCCLFAQSPAVETDAETHVAPVIQQGFKSWGEKNDASYAFDVWKKGGFLDSDNKPAVLAGYFSRIDRTIGNYKGYEVIDAKRVSRTSQVFYVSVNFEHAVVYAKFLVYKTSRDWVVQNMDFSPKPENIMPWLAFEGVNYGQ